jgi:sirohydrochlorin cobaltochelatase
VADDQFLDATLLVLAHGSTVNSDSAVAARHQAAVLRGRGLFAAVQECFWKQAPGLEESLRNVRTSRVFVAPLFIGPGYFAEEVIPVTLGLKVPGETSFARVQRRGGQTLYYTQPVGLHPRMTEVLLAKAREVVVRHPFPRAPRPDETTLVVVGHGTERTASSRRAVEAQVERLRTRGGYAEVRPAFMEDEPRVADCLGVARSRHVVVVPFFISDGLHVAEDIPVLLGEPPDRVQARVRAGQSAWRNPTERQGRLVWYAPGIGLEPLLAEVILDRVREAAAWPAPD